ncbi:hypothetical protein NSMS1_34220 [Nostoc sp. MS1]|nr:hypothetical protein NSMS1_34220 [Nostoc sp. MS1]
MTDATAVVKLTNDVTAQLQETTSTAVGSIAGASTDSQTNATVINPTQAQLPSLSNPTELIQKTGQVTLGVEINQNGVKVNAGADLKAALANLAKVDICLDASASLGSIDDGSLADCSQLENLKTVPEPTNIAALGIISTYILFLKGKLSKSGKVSVS